MRNSDPDRQGFYGWLANTIERFSPWLIVGTVVITLLLLLPLFLMKPTEMASDNPLTSKVVQLSDEIKDRFPSEVYTMFFIVEARDGDMLTRDNLTSYIRTSRL